MNTILHVIDTTGPGGAETIFLQLAEESTRQGYRCIALIRGNGWVNSELRKLGIETHIIDCKGSFNLIYLFKLISLIKKENITVIQSHLLGSNVYCSLAGALTGTKVISTFHGLVDIAPNERFKLLKLMILRLGSYSIVTVTDRLKNHIQEAGLLKHARIKTIYNGVSIGAYSKICADHFKQQHNISHDKLVIGSLGNIRLAKNYPLAIKTISEVRDLGINAHYFIAGQGNDEQMAPLNNLIEKISLQQHVTLLGFTANTQEFLSSLDIFLMTSSSEGHPLAITQAMINELAIVTTKSGVEEIISNEQEALISEEHDEKALAKLIATIFNEPSTGKKLAHAANKLATEKYSLENMYNEYFSLYA